MFHRLLVAAEGHDDVAYSKEPLCMAAAILPQSNVCRPIRNRYPVVEIWNKKTYDNSPKPTKSVNVAK